MSEKRLKAIDTLFLTGGGIPNPSIKSVMGYGVPKTKAQLAKDIVVARRDFYNRGGIVNRLPSEVAPVARAIPFTTVSETGQMSQRLVHREDFAGIHTLKDRE